MRFLSLLAVGALGLALGVAPAHGQIETTEQKLTLADSDRNDAFGSALALDGTTLAVGSDNAAVYLFERGAEATSAWTEGPRLRAVDVATSEQRAERFGRAIALDGDRLVVGASGATTEAFVYERTAGVWSVSAVLVDDPENDDEEFNDAFGSAVAVEGDRIAVGAPGEGDFNEGSVYVFERQSGGWATTALLTDPDGRTADFFGRQVALAGDRLAVASNAVDLDGARDGGAVFIYDRAPGGTWTRAAKLTASDAAEADGLGTSIAFNGPDELLVGADDVDGPGGVNTGAVYVFRFDGTTWREDQKLTNPDAERFESLGASVAAQDDRAWVGALGIGGQGGAAEFVREPGGWVRARTLLPTGGSSTDRLGTSIAFDGGRLVIGAPNDDDQASNAGASYAYTADMPPPPTLSLFVQERIGVSDAPRLLSALQLFVQERIGVSDAPRLLGALQLIVQERIAVSDGPGVALEDGSAAATAQPVRLDTDLVSFFAPTGIDVAFEEITTPGGLSVFYEAAAPDNTEGLPDETIAPYRWVIAATNGLAFERASVRFDTDAFPSLADPERVTIYRRPDAGTGAFEEVTTSVDPDDGALVGSGITAFSEFVIAGDGVVVSSEADLPLVFALDGPYPNPATTEATLDLALPEPGPIRVEVLDLLGRRVALLAEGDQPAGYVTLRLRTDRLAAGSYFIRLQAGDEEAVARLTVVR
ncbi:MAG: T9SS type A sorting domain-containing protein [Bacteroidota bacterium]